MTKIDEPMTDRLPHWYLTFSDDGWRGFCIVPAANEAMALLRSHALGINPGGEVLLYDMSEVGRRVPDNWLDTLYTTEDDVRAFDVLMGGTGEVVVRNV